MLDGDRRALRASAPAPHLATPRPHRSRRTAPTRRCQGPRTGRRSAGIADRLADRMRPAPPRHPPSPAETRPAGKAPERPTRSSSPAPARRASPAQAPDRCSTAASRCASQNVGQRFDRLQPLGLDALQQDVRRPGRQRQLHLARPPRLQQPAKQPRNGATSANSSGRRIWFSRMSTMRCDLAALKPITAPCPA